MWENTDQNKSKYGHFLRSVCQKLKLFLISQYREYLVSVFFVESMFKLSLHKIPGHFSQTSFNVLFDYLTVTLRDFLLKSCCKSLYWIHWKKVAMESFFISVQFSYRRALPPFFRIAFRQNTSNRLLCTIIAFWCNECV